MRCPAWLVVVTLGCGACGRPVVVDDTPPVADAGGDRYVEVDVSTTFDASASADEAGPLSAWRWSFPAGVVEGAVVDHTFTEAGRYVVALTVVDEAGLDDTDEIVVTVTGAAPAPVIAMTPAADVRAFTEVMFDASGTSAREDLAAWRWSFGDGTTATGEQVAHTFERPGTFTVRLEVEDVKGEVGEATLQMAVLPVDVEGTWTLSSAPASFSCSSYDARFDEGTLTLTIDDDGETLTGASPSGATWSGALDGASFTLESTTVVDVGSACPSAPVTTTISAELLDDDTFSAQVTRWYDLSYPCQCSALFTVDGER